MNEDKKMSIRLPFDVKNTMTEICGIKNGPTIMGAWGKDSGTMERRLKLALVYPDGEVSPIHEYNQRKLTSAKALSDLADMDGVSVKLVEGCILSSNNPWFCQSKFLGIATEIPW